MTRSRIALVLCLLGCSSIASDGQTPITYTVRIYAEGATAPLSTTSIAPSAVVCGQVKVPAGNPMVILPPVTLRFDDPRDATKDCVIVDDGSGPLLAMPIGQQYQATLAVIADSGESARTAFTRAVQEPGQWDEIQAIGPASGYTALTAAGPAVAFVTGNGTVTGTHSQSEGAVVAQPWMSIGVGWPALERPMAATLGTMGLITNDNSGGSFSDICCPRPQSGDLFARRSTNRGQAWSAPIRLTTGHKFIRYSLDISGAAWHVVGMHWTGTAWNIVYVRSDDDGMTWQAPVTLSAGANAMGEHRPSVTAAGEDVFVTWMGAAHAQPGSCELENGTKFAYGCTDIYAVRSIDGGVTFLPIQRLTTDAPAVYSGRPSATRKGQAILVAYDRRTQPGGTLANEIGLLTSLDNGATFTTSLLVSAAGDQTHGVPVWHPTRGVCIPWMDRRSGTYAIYQKCALDGLQFGPEALVSGSGGNATAPSAAWSDNAFHVLWTNTVGLQYRRLAFSGAAVVPAVTMTASPASISTGQSSTITIANAPASTYHVVRMTPGNLTLTLDTAQTTWTRSVSPTATTTYQMTAIHQDGTPWVGLPSTTVTVGAASNPCVDAPLTLDWNTVTPLSVTLLTDSRGCTSKRP